jgi:transposase
MRARRPSMKRTRKQYSRVATRFDEKAASYLGFVWLAAISIMPA